MTLSKLRVVLEASVGGFNRAIRSSGRVLGSMLNGVKSLTGGLFSLGTAFKAMLAVLALRRLAMAAKSIFDIGAAVAETQDKFDTTFGAAADSVQKFLDQWATMAGLSNEVAQDMVATTGAMLVGMGLTQQGAADLAKEILKLAGDFASFNNLRTEEPLLAITAALASEREALKRLGVVLTENMVQQRAMADSGVANAKALTLQSKVLATVALITEKAGVQTDNLAQTQTSAANRAKQLGATWTDLRNTMATLLQPAFLTIMETMANSEISFVKLDKKIRDNSATIVGWVAGAIEAFKIFGEALKGMVTNAVVVLGALGTALALALGAPLVAGVALFAMLAGLSREYDNLGDVQSRVLGKFNEAVDLFNRAAAAGKSGMGDLTFIMGTTIEQVSALNNELTKMATNFADRIGDATQDGMEAFEGFFSSVMRGLARLIARMALLRGLMSLFPSSSFVSALGSSMGIAGAPALPTAVNTGGPPTGFAGPMSPRTSSVFNQSVNFNISAIDAGGVDAVIRQQSGTIVAVVAEAAQSSSAFRRTMRGG